MDELIEKTVPEDIRLDRPLKLDAPLCKEPCILIITMIMIIEPTLSNIILKTDWFSSQLEVTFMVLSPASVLMSFDIKNSISTLLC